MDIKQWEHHIIHTLKYYGLKPLDVKYNTMLTKTCYGKHGKMQQWMEISFESELHPHKEWPDWMVSNNINLLQTNGCSCGPIACAKVMEIFGLLEPGSMATI